MRLLRSDLPLDREGAWRYLPWILAMMVYLAALALAGSLAVDDAVAGWKRGLIGQFTVRSCRSRARARMLPARGARADDDDHLTTISRSRDPGARRRGDARAGQPGSARSTRALDLPLPDVIAVTARPGESLDAATIEERLANSGVETVIDDHGRWARDLVRFGRGLQLMAAIVVAIVAAAGVLVVYFVTRTGLAVHARIIEIAHLVGARTLVARQISAMRCSSVCSAPSASCWRTWWALGHIVGLVAVPFLPALQPDWLRWLWIALLVPVAGFLAMLTARRTVFATLRRML
jgi:cell division transport system permease protein